MSMSEDQVVNAGAETVDTTPSTPTEPGAEATSTAPEQQQDWFTRVQGLSPEEQELARGYLEKIAVTVKHGKTGQELPLPMSELLNLAEQGFDAQSKTKAAAEAMRFYETYQQNQDMVDAGVVLAQQMLANPALAQQIAPLIMQYEQQQQGGYVPQSPAEYALWQENQRFRQAETERQQLAEQQAYEKHVEQIQSKLKSDVQQIVKENPNLFDESKAGQIAKLNRWKLEQEASQLASNGIYHPNLMGFSFYNLFGKQMDKQVISRYINNKQNNAPPVGAGGTPTGGGQQNLTKDQYFARGRARLMGTAYNG